jgi:hypothetical protein
MTNRTATWVASIASFVFALIYVFSSEPFFMMMAILQAIFSAQYAVLDELEKGRK